MRKSLEVFKDEKNQTEGTAFRVQVANIADDSLYGCEARLPVTPPAPNGWRNGACNRLRSNIERRDASYQRVGYEA